MHKRVEEVILKENKLAAKGIYGIFFLRIKSTMMILNDG
jgi:hypothetical protein